VKSYSNRQIDLVQIGVPGHFHLAVTVTIKATVTALRIVSVVEVAAQEEALEVRQEMGEANPLVRISQRPTGMYKIQSPHNKSFMITTMRILKIQIKAVTRRISQVR
jgi:hypothetical protein